MPKSPKPKKAAVAKKGTKIHLRDGAECDEEEQWSGVDKSSWKKGEKAIVVGSIERRAE